MAKEVDDRTSEVHSEGAPSSLLDCDRILLEMASCCSAQVCL